MARPLNQQRRTAILTGATEVIATHGIGASTAAIAQQAGVSNGSLFIYFPTKADLLNALYVELKTEMGTIATDGLDPAVGSREQVRHMWTRWLAWAAAAPAKRRALAQLGVAEEVTADSHAAANAAMAGVAELLEHARAGGPAADAPLGFILTLANAVAESAIDAILSDPAHADALSDAACAAIWRVLAGSA